MPQNALIPPLILSNVPSIHTLSHTHTHTQHTHKHAHIAHTNTLRTHTLRTVTTLHRHYCAHTTQSHTLFESTFVALKNQCHITITRLNK